MPVTPSQPKKYGSARQAADLVGVSTRTIHRYVAEGRIRAFRCGPKLIRLDLNEVERALIADR